MTLRSLKQFSRVFLCAILGCALLTGPVFAVDIFTREKPDTKGFDFWEREKPEEPSKEAQGWILSEGSTENGEPDFTTVAFTEYWHNDIFYDDENNILYYKGMRVRFFHDRVGDGYYNVFFKEDGILNIQVIRDQFNGIVEIKYLTIDEVQDIFSQLEFSQAKDEPIMDFTNPRNR